MSIQLVPQHSSDLDLAVLDRKDVSLVFQESLCLRTITFLEAKLPQDMQRTNFLDHKTELADTIFSLRRTLA